MSACGEPTHSSQDKQWRDNASLIRMTSLYQAQLNGNDDNYKTQIHPVAEQRFEKSLHDTSS